MNTGLTNEAKARIEAEELYRAELRAKLETSTQPREIPKVDQAQLDREEGRRVVGQFALKVVLWIGLPLLTVFAISRFQSSSTQDAQSSQWVNVAVQCERLVKNQLKSPSTAEFTDAYQQRAEITSTATGMTWDGWVDSENSFGASIRSHFTCDYNEAKDQAKITFNSQ
jgi:hypothetical protein